MSDKNETKLVKCQHCKKKTVTFYYHECKRSTQEYFGCNKCDDWCVYCNEKWADGDVKNKKK